ncbi:hypothetical protein BKA62DRAFT_711196 [Auriculariales sp. MPI-PUGE-AT-0066]|nr:hypothetical protein BKA62DRAFT_711196 [Auriculariales sp. MPI-PUGE-AT-0066]
MDASLDSPHLSLNVLSFITPVSTPRAVPKELPAIDRECMLLAFERRAMFKLSHYDWCHIVDSAGAWRSTVIDAMILVNRALRDIFEHIKVASLVFHGPHTQNMWYSEDYNWNPPRIEAIVHKFGQFPHLSRSVTSLSLDKWGCHCDEIECTEHLYIRDFLLREIIPSFSQLTHLELQSVQLDMQALAYFWQLSSVHRLVMDECCISPSQDVMLHLLGDLQALSSCQQLAPRSARIKELTWNSGINAAFLFSFKNLTVLETDCRLLISAGAFWSTKSAQPLPLTWLCIKYSYISPDPDAMVPPTDEDVIAAAGPLTAFITRCPKLRVLKLPQPGNLCVSRQAAHCKTLDDLAIIPSPFEEEQEEEEQEELKEFVNYLLENKLGLPRFFEYHGWKTPLTVDELLTIFGPVLRQVQWCHLQLTLIEHTNRYEINQIFTKHGEFMPNMVHFQFGNFVALGPKSLMEITPAFISYNSWIPFMLNDVALPVCPRLACLQFSDVCRWVRFDRHSWRGEFLSEDR